MTALFRCETVYQLINAINIKHSLLSDEKADLCLGSSTDFSPYVQTLRDVDVFENVLVSPDNVVDLNREYNVLSDAEITERFQNPSKYIHDVGFAEWYDHYYIAVDRDIYNQLIYYDMVKKGHKPVVHLFEEGFSTYVFDIHQNEKARIIRHNSYESADRLASNIKDIYVYEPELYCLGKKTDVLQLPKITEENESLIGVLTHVFGEASLPDERYIFFEEAAFTDYRNTTDFEILNTIAGLVGKDNIIVKLHPRTVYDRFSPSGFKVMPESRIPWEISMLKSDLKGKVFLTVSSTSSINSSIVLGKKSVTVFLADLMKVSQSAHMRQKVFSQYFNLLTEKINENEKYLFRPKNIETLEACLEYIEGRMSLLNE